MIDLLLYVDHLNDIAGTVIDNSLLIDCLMANNWYGVKKSWLEDKLMIDEEIENYNSNIIEYLKNIDLPFNVKFDKQMYQMKKQFPQTGKSIIEFMNEYEIDMDEIYIIVDFLNYYLNDEISYYENDDIDGLLEIVNNELNLYHSSMLCEYLYWNQMNNKTFYNNKYVMTKRYTNTESTEAYSTQFYLKLMFVLFNEEYIKENDMYYKASKSKDMTDIWLFLALHFICALRDTDLIRICHPRLTDTPASTIMRIGNGTFTDSEARQVLYSITWRLSSLPLTPSKTSKHAGISSIKLCFPESTEILFGRLFALAEAHRINNKIPDYDPLIRVIKDFKRIKKYMGEDIGDMFLEADFRSRQANKAYLQSIYQLTSNIFENDDEFNTKGYILAALARSHKGSYGTFAQTTAIYLKDAKMSGYSAEYVAKELFERGVLSFTVSSLLKMIIGEKYEALNIEQQTYLSKVLDLSPNSIENSVSLSQKALKQGSQIARSIYNSENRKQIIDILHKIGNGNAASKQDGCLCLLIAMGKMCIEPARSGCIGCKYEISTKSTIFLMIEEYNRLLKEYNNNSNPTIKLKNKYLIKEIILPKANELIQCVYEQYGKEAAGILEAIVKEVANEKR